MKDTPHIIATFAEARHAEQAFKDLEAFIPTKDISFMHLPQGEQNETVDASADGVLDGVGIGAAIGGIGGLLFGLTMLTIPGIGPLLAAGPIYGAVAGATSGGLIGGLADMGLNRYQAEKITTHIQQGYYVIAVEVPTPHLRKQITQLFQRYQAIEVVDEPVQ